MIQIRKAEAKDITFVKAIEVEGGLSGWTEKDYLNELERSDSLFFVAAVKSEVIGFILARLIMTQPSIPNDMGEIEIYNIGVKSAFRRRSAGIKLINEITEFGKKNNIKTIFLEVRKSNERAIIFYKNRLFHKVGERIDYYSNPTENAVLMSLTLTAKKDP